MTDEKKCGCNAHTEESKIKRPGYYGAKRPVQDEVNARGGKLELSKAWSRSILKGEIHEIMLTPTAHSPGETLPGFTAVAFFEATQGSHTQTPPQRRRGRHPYRVRDEPHAKPHEHRVHRQRGIPGVQTGRPDQDTVTR